MKKIKRLYHWFYANIHGYFWLPCPLCGEYFGGHETIEIGSPCIMTSWSDGRMVCPKCIGKAEEYNKHFMETNPLKAKINEHF